MHYFFPSNRLLTLKATATSIGREQRRSQLFVEGMLWKKDDHVHIQDVQIIVTID